MSLPELQLEMLLTLLSPFLIISIFIQFGFALGSGLGGLVLSRKSILNLSWISAGTVLRAYS